MPLEPRDAAYLWDMLDAARAITSFTRGRSLEDYLADRMLRGAVERNLEVIGEAARQVSRTLREEHPEIPWRSIVAQRNVLAHEYGEVSHERVWAVCRTGIPALVRSLEKFGIERPNPGDP